MADPRALQIATSAMYALEKIGYPEARIPLAEAIIYVCEADKSNSVVNAMYAAVADAKEVRDDNIPVYLKDNSYGGKEDKANSAKYKYPHDYGGYVEQQYLPNSLMLGILLVLIGFLNNPCTLLVKKKSCNP